MQVSDSNFYLKLCIQSDYVYIHLMILPALCDRTRIWLWSKMYQLLQWPVISRPLHVLANGANCTAQLDCGSLRWFSSDQPQKSLRTTKRNVITIRPLLWMQNEWTIYLDKSSTHRSAVLRRNYARCFLHAHNVDKAAWDESSFKLIAAACI